ncbi:MAG: hypothetical protein HFI90_05610 [Clostridia bacterium]|nr:hypothetical protein [Clostridia bacterium]
MNEFEFKNSGFDCCPRDADGNLVTPDNTPIVRNPDGTIRPPYTPPETGGVAPSPMNPPIDQGENSIVTPPEGEFNTEAFQGSMQQILSDNIGQFVVCEFIIGTGPTLTVKEGVLYSVGRSFIVLYEELNRNYVVCDIFSIKFVTFYLPGQRPRRYTSGGATTAGGRMRR